MSATAEPRTSAAADSRPLRIGEVAEATGTTPRTIRYYEEIGLLGEHADRQQGKHRVYSQADIERINEIVRMRDLLGLSLDQLREVLEAESARAQVRRELSVTEAPTARRRLLHEAHGHITNQLALVRGRIVELSKLADELEQRRDLVAERIDELSD